VEASGIEGWVSTYLDEREQHYEAGRIAEQAQAESILAQARLAEVNVHRCEAALAVIREMRAARDAAREPAEAEDIGE
tara:strand:- start:785 stop:1018 length:234 start_codon:yes stop_codon:yes gene_type:complete